ncbi:hypothetical protein M409DRAFT_28031 [Zasmidium cellare ATCC 36951]|uniref:DNA/RNA-binding protein Alba-like domain-containing protein n=1 Tax=Zasmidium cellare ATCC 36951 TaxID=1080233 RepID=A0A6A6C3C1_ZASCE|nr:uncharacterized protein M409DRAFT_28031 [Zasmidium cellare ATCC 36951]KAF2161637.1 hypothetical protein M409DRAFT_28031 [Zasmidium cellare ATCC 36951]
MPQPPVINDTTLSATHSLVKFSIHTSTQISRRTSAVLENLQPQDPSNNDNNGTGTGTEKPVIVALTAPTPNATNKLITIVEIAKRELKAKDAKCFQYNALRSELMDVPRAKKGKGEGEGGVGEGASFETMGEREFGETKKRNVPVMTVYLSLSSVRELKVAFGEQV